MRMTEEQYASRLKSMQNNAAKTAEKIRLNVLLGNASESVVKPFLKKHKPSKHRNKKTLLDGIIFDSKVESERYAELKLLEKAGEIVNLERKVKFELAPSVVINGRKRPPLRYYADFTYFLSGGRFVCEDVKGSEKVTEGYRIKRHLMKSVFDINILETRK